MPIAPLAVLEREDIALFVNAACACTGQSEFYGHAASQRVSLGFLHRYAFGNYRRLYALCLAADINHFNQAAVIARLLRAGAPADPIRRAEEAALLAGALREMPPQRVYKLFGGLRRGRVNNRRTRATMRDWLKTRDLTFDALKYRGHLRSAARHAHLSLPDELHGFLFEGPHSRPGWSSPLLDSFRRAKYDQSAIYELPFTVAEGLAAQKKVPRKRFLERIAPRMTRGERARVEQRARREGADVGELDLDRVPLTKLCTLLLGLPFAERDEPRWQQALERSALRALKGSPGLPGRVRAVLDNSFSARGGAQKRNRPVAVALGISQVLRMGASDYRAHWTAPPSVERKVRAHGQTNLATPLLDALEDRPDLVVVVSDGFENDPPGAVGALIGLFRERIDPQHATAIVHVNPVFDATSFMPRPLGPSVPTLGVHAAEDLPHKLAFARFVQGDATVHELERWLEGRAARWLGTS